MPLEINYHELNTHKLMLHDTIRGEAFRRALDEKVTPGSAVLDVGAGTGLLSIFAAQAGARVVYAVERTKTARLAERIIADNGLSDLIQVIEDDMENITLPGQVDVIVSEWIGGYGVDENLLPVIVQARDRWLKPGGSMIPGRVSSWLAPAYDDDMEQDVRFWKQRPYGIELSAIAEETSERFLCCRYDVKEEHIMADPQQMWEVDAASTTLSRATSPFKAEQAFICRKRGRFNGLAAWFEAHLSEGNVLSNKPSEQWVHWGRWVFPIGTCLDVEEGTHIAVSFRLTPERVGQSRIEWHVSTGDYCFSSEDWTSLTK